MFVIFAEGRDPEIMSQYHYRCDPDCFGIVGCDCRYYWLRYSSTEPHGFELAIKFENYIELSARLWGELSIVFYPDRKEEE